MVIFDLVLQAGDWYEVFLANNGRYKWEIIHTLNVLVCFVYFRVARHEIDCWLCNIMCIPPLMLLCVTVLFHKPFFFLFLFLCFLLFGIVAYAASTLEFTNKEEK
jgi:hypothetical protein